MEQMDAFRAEQQVDLLTGGGQHPVHLWMVRQHLTIMSNALRWEEMWSNRVSPRRELESLKFRDREPKHVWFMKSGYYVATDTTSSQPPDWSEEHVQSSPHPPSSGEPTPKDTGEIYDELPETFSDDTWGFPQVDGRSSKKQINVRYYSRISFILLKNRLKII